MLNDWYNFQFLGACCQRRRSQLKVALVGRACTWVHFASTCLVDWEVASVIAFIDPVVTDADMFANISVSEQFHQSLTRTFNSTVLIDQGHYIQTDWTREPAAAVVKIRVILWSFRRCRGLLPGQSFASSGCWRCPLQDEDYSESRPHSFPGLY